MVLAKNWKVVVLFILCKIGEVNVFDDILDR